MSQSSTPAVTDAIYDASSLGRPRMFLLGLQHLCHGAGARAHRPFGIGNAFVCRLGHAAIPLPVTR